MPPEAKRPSKLARLLLRQQQIQAQIKATSARQRAQDRKDDTRRKILVGALILEQAKRDEDIAHLVLRLTERFLSRPAERALFDLPPLPETGQDNEQAATGAFSASSRQG